MRTPFLVVLLCFLLALAGAVGFFWGDKHALDRLGVVDVTPDQMAQAMSADNFYGLWREDTLVASGMVAGVTKQGGDTLIQLETSSVSKVYCDIGTTSTSLAIGANIRVLAEGERANRIPQGVTLVGCTVL
ncbi:MAG: hypothetical protein KGI78_02370 [Patescibacteria group bacterium]|nr:hypothetical protein [Patescibacteria group bacterium]MDE1945142.1 hypothetical protein [Patescibacteria group bacterium]MDE2057677.1 hypothetical protein [Patescibacteria group bacterium]